MQSFKAFVAGAIRRTGRTYRRFFGALINRAERTAKVLIRKFIKLPSYLKLTGVTLLLAAAIFVGLQYQNYRHAQLYAVSAASRQLVGQSSIDTSKVGVTAKAISYSETDQQLAKQGSVSIAGPTDASGKTGYQTTIKTAFKQGLSFGESSSQLSFTMTPLFGAGKAVYQKGQMMFPVSDSIKIFQTFKKNGVKEDIVLTQAPSKTASWQWRLNLGDKLAAKLLPDGSVGIFAANPNLYGDIKISDAKSQALIDKARTTAKDYLIFAIPAPNIKNAKGQTLKEDVNYKLAGDTLTLEARNLDNQHYPISIDPSVVMTTTADFATGMDDGMINYSVANQIGRSNISLGTVGATAQQTNAFTTARNSHTSVAYNGFVYVIGGYDGASYHNDIQFSAMGSGGSLSCPAGYTCGGGTVFAVNTTGFTTARFGHTSVAYNGYLYIVGGSNGTAQNDVQHCPINSDGSIGTCVQQTNAFTTPRSGHTSVAYNGYLYVIGGTNSNATIQYNDIQHMPINADGSVGTAVSQAAAFTTARYIHTSVAYNGYLYVIGGTNGATNYNNIQHCPINADGSVGTCVVQAAAFTTARWGHTSVAYNGYIYVIGGNSGVNQNDAQYLLISTGTATGFGTLAAGIDQATAFTGARGYQSSVAYNGYLYIIGGYIAGVAQNDIQFSTINSNGSLSCPATFTCPTGVFARQTAAFTTPRWDHTSVVYNGYLYIIGGSTTTVPLNDVQHCPLNANGSVGTCVVQTTAFAAARSNHTSVVNNGFVYIIGGCSSGGCTTIQNDIEFASINSDGSLSCPATFTCTTGVFAQQANAYITPRWVHASVVYNGYLYIMGGCSTNANCGTFLNDIQHCPLNANGSVGACVNQTNAFTTPRYGHSVAVSNGALYIMGGADSSFIYGDIQYCPINADGSVGTCTATSGLVTARADQTTVAYGGYLYVAGGSNGPYNDVQRLAVLAPALTAHYERVIDLGLLADRVDSIQYNGTTACGAKLQYATAGSNGVFGALTTVRTDDAMPAIAYGLTGETLKRYVRVDITLNDQNCGGTSSISDITVNYSLTPDPPTLVAPASGAFTVALTPLFQLKTTHASDTYTQYKIIVYQSDCSTLVRTIDQTGSQVGWSGQDAQTGTAYMIGATLGASTLASHTYQAAGLSLNTTYCWKAAAIDPGGTNTFGNFSPTQLFSTNLAPSAPSLVLPTAAQTAVSTLPELRLVSTDVDGDYVRYKIQICTVSDCSSVLRTIDETSSQTGWQSQSLQSTSAYASGQTAVHSYQAAGLAYNTQYWWRGYAIDPAGSNVFGAASTIGTFTTAATAQSNINVEGGTTIYGGAKLGP